MGLDTWVQFANAYQTSSTTAGSALASSTSLTDVSPGGSTVGQAYTFPLPFRVGDAWEISANGIYSTTGTPTLLLGLYYGGVGGTALCATAATTTGSGVANGVWRLTADMHITAVGTSGTALTIGSVSGIGTGPVLMPATSSTGGAATIATGTANILTVGCQWGTSSASNSLVCYWMAVKKLAGP